jgi:hypothetical protein
MFSYDAAWCQVAIHYDCGNMCNAIAFCLGSNHGVVHVEHRDITRWAGQALNHRHCLHAGCTSGAKNSILRFVLMIGYPLRNSLHLVPRYRVKLAVRGPPAPNMPG